MTAGKSDERVTVAQAAAQKQKRPYKKPSFRSERVFETMALSCGKVIPAQSGCRFNSKNS
jgi:hypothetical protein